MATNDADEIEVQYSERIGDALICNNCGRPVVVTHAPESGFILDCGCLDDSVDRPPEGWLKWTKEGGWRDIATLIRKLEGGEEVLVETNKSLIGGLVIEDAKFNAPNVAQVLMIMDRKAEGGCTTVALRYREGETPYVVYQDEQRRESIKSISVKQDDE